MTAKIKLNAASGGGSVSLQAPSSCSNNRVFTIPDLADATLLTSNATLGKFASYAIICDQKGSNDDSGTFTDGADRTRDLNTEISDADGIVSINNNQFTLQAGSYLIKASCPANRVYRHGAKIYNVTDSSLVQEGTSAYADDSTGGESRSWVMARVTITGAKAFEIRHRCQSTRATNGFGIKVEGTGVLANNIFTLVEIYKES